MNKNYLLLKKKTIKNREKIKRVYFDPFIKQFNGVMKPLDAYEILNNKHLSPVTMHVIMKYLKTMCNEDKIPYDEIEMKKVIKFIENRARHVKRKALTEEEAKEVLLVTRANFPQFYLPVLIGLHTGIRKGELFGLQWNDLIKTNNKYYMIVRRTYGETSTKNNISKRIPVSKDVKEGLNRLFFKKTKAKNHRPHREAKIFGKKKIDEFFSSLRPLLSFKKPVSFHILRHTFATILLNKNVIAKDVQQMMGHSSVSTTLDMYWTRPVDLETDVYLPSITKRRTNGQKETAERSVKQTNQDGLQHHSG
jgi:integrase